MKGKVFLTLLAAIGFAAGANAQITVKPSIGLSITDFSKTSVSSSTGITQPGSKGKVGFQIGGTIAYGQKVYIESGLFYTVKNSEFTYSNQGQTNTQKLNDDILIKGLKVPVHIGVNILGNSDSFIGVRAFGGPTAFYVLSTGKDVDVSTLKRFNFGLNAGAGVDIWKFFVEASYEWSLTNIQKDISTVDLGKHRTIYVQAGLRLNL